VLKPSIIDFIIAWLIREILQYIIVYNLCAKFLYSIYCRNSTVNMKVIAILLAVCLALVSAIYYPYHNYQNKGYGPSNYGYYGNKGHGPYGHGYYNNHNKHPPKTGFSGSNFGFGK